MEGILKEKDNSSSTTVEVVVVMRGGAVVDTLEVSFSSLTKLCSRKKQYCGCLLVCDNSEGSTDVDFVVVRFHVVIVVVVEKKASTEVVGAINQTTTTHDAMKARLESLLLVIAMIQFVCDK